MPRAEKNAGLAQRRRPESRPAGDSAALRFVPMDIREHLAHVVTVFTAPMARVCCQQESVETLREAGVFLAPRHQTRLLGGIRFPARAMPMRSSSRSASAPATRRPNSVRV